jgi:hypothetical protein
MHLYDSRFLLARLHIDSLLDKMTPRDVKAALAKLTKGAAALDIAYGEALHRIESQLEGHRELARKTLSWITLAKRPLTTVEICCALAVEPDEDEVDPENVVTSGDLVSVCAGLVVVDQESAVIRLVHYTTQEYFERTGDAWNPGGKLHIATTCLTYLSFSTFRSSSSSSDEEFEARLQQNQLLDYAAKHWGSHVRAVETEVVSLACELLQGKSLLCVAQVLGVPKYKYRGYSKNYSVGSALHYTSQFGLSGITKKVLAAANVPIEEAVNARDSWGNTPLTIAAEYGQYEMAKMLLDKGADVNAQGGEYRNALQAASVGDHEQVVKMLLDNGADVNAQGGRFGNALLAASVGGHKQVVKMLLNKGADVNAQGGEYRNALYAASKRGYKQVVKMLVDKGADVNAQGGRFGNALRAASERDHEQVVEMLLDAGAH